MNYEETLSTLKAIQASYSPTPFLMDPDTEPRFVINSDERTIEIPDEFKFLAVKMDHMSERIYFEIPRYFDGEDLATKTCVVQYINANKEEAVEGIASVADVDYTSVSEKIIFRWDVDNNVTKYAGDVSFSVRFYTISDDNRFTYSWNTVPATLPVLDTLDNTGATITENYPTELILWQYRMTELDRTISEKIEEATASIDADTKAAQEARQGAEDAEARVNAIVAGNESYTKQQSHDLFALALRGTAEAAKSITIYPDKGSNVVATINGFTTQAGTGDPSPTNVRALTNGGLRMYKLVIDGSHSITKDTGISGTVYYKVNVTCPANVDGTSVAGYSKQYCNRAQIKNADGQTQGDYAWVYGENLCRIAFFSKPWITTAEAMQADLAADPLIIWYIPADESQATGLYAPIILQSGEYRATCLPLTAPLCEGDSVVSWARSGCDKVVTFDGSEDEKWLPLYGAAGIFYIDLTNAEKMPNTLPVITDRLYYVSSGDSYSSVTYGDFSTQYLPGIVRFIIRADDSSTDPRVCRAYISAHPLTVWYRSANYTDAADIPVSLETHQQAVLVLDGTALYTVNNQQSWPDGYAQFYSAKRSFPGVADFKGLCSHCYYGLPPSSGYPSYTLVDTSGGLYICLEDQLIGTTGESCKAYLAAQYAAGTPVTVVHQLDTPITYAHPAVVLPALPEDTGKVTITGEADGTVSAEYNKNITKALEDILTRVSALELHALGG